MVAGAWSDFWNPKKTGRPGGFDEGNGWTEAIFQAKHSQEPRTGCVDWSVSNKWITTWDLAGLVLQIVVLFMEPQDCPGESSSAPFNPPKRIRQPSSTRLSHPLALVSVHFPLVFEPFSFAPCLEKETHHLHASQRYSNHPCRGSGCSNPETIAQDHPRTSLAAGQNCFSEALASQERVSFYKPCSSRKPCRSLVWH